MRLNWKVMSSLLGVLLIAVLLPNAASADYGQSCGVLNVTGGDHVHRFDIVKTKNIPCRAARNLTKRIERGARGWKRDADGSVSKYPWICEEVGRGGYCRNDRTFATVGWIPHHRK